MSLPPKPARYHPPPLCTLCTLLVAAEVHFGAAARWRRATILTTPGSWLWCSCYTFPCSLPDANRSEVVFHGPPPAIQTLGAIPTSLEFPILVVMSARRQCDNPGLRTRDGRLDPPPPRGASWKPWGQPRGPRVGHCRRDSTQTCPCPLPCPLPSPTTVAIVLTVQTVCGRLRVRMIIEAQRKAGGFSLSPPPPASSPPSVPAFCPCLSSSMCVHILKGRVGVRMGLRMGVCMLACLCVRVYLCAPHALPRG